MQDIIVYANIRAEFARQRVTITEVAVLLGVNRTTATRKLAGRASFTLPEAVTLAKKLDRSIEYLFAELFK